MGRLRSYSYLPQDLLEEILTKLPVISIIRFKCVNKSWYNLFENHTFIAKHHRHHSSQKNPSLLVEVEDSTTTPQRSVMSLHLADDLDSVVSLDMPFIPERLVYISDCINGIICLRELSSRLVLWNPAVREYKVIPNPPSHVHSPSNVCYDYPTFAFGYDHISNDYKLVQIGTYSTVLYDLIDQILHPVVYIYTLSTDSWRQIDTGSDHSILNFPGDCSNNLYLNGVYHWPGCILDEHGRHCEVIVCFDMRDEVCFDMRDEVFQIMKMPNLGDISHIGKIWKTAAVLNDCAALIIFYLKQTKQFDIWMMNEYGVEESWTKQFVIGPLIVELTLLDQLLLVDDKLALINDKGHILLYDLGAQEIKHLQLRKLPGSVFVSQAITYVESLVSVTRGKVEAKKREYKNSILNKIICCK